MVGKTDPVLSHARLPAAVLGVAALVSGCSPAESQPAPPIEVAWMLPDGAAGFDYQLGGGYAPPPGVTIVVRDRTDVPSGAGYDICYVNGFQTQPGESAAFAAAHPDLLVQIDGKPLADPGWPDEYLFDTSTEPKRTAIAAIVRPWIEGCAAAGFAAVEIDNLDSYTRAEGALTADANVALAAEYAEIAHESGLAIAQKNAVDLAPRLGAARYDFAITESCVHFDECAAYAEVYPVVLDIEYPDELGEQAFAAACGGATRPAAMILRDHDLTTPGDDAYVYRNCGP